MTLDQPAVDRRIALAGQVIVVTGAGSGIGQATVLRCMSEGADVVAADLNEFGIDRTIALAQSRGLADHIHGVRTDVSNEEDVAAAMAAAVTRFGDLHGVFNNAGFRGALGAITDIRVEDWDRTMAVLLRGPFLGIKHGVRTMRDRGHGGWIVTTSSTASFGGGSGPIAYATAKAALLNLTRATAVELAPERIRVNAVSPGVILTPRNDDGDPDGAAVRFDQAQPWPDHGMPDDIAAAVVFLASADARFITGENLVVDGGSSINRGMATRLYGSNVFAQDPGFDSGLVSE